MVRHLPYLRGDWTHTELALTLVKDKLLKQRNPKRPVIILVVTDGRPEYPNSDARRHHLPKIERTDRHWKRNTRQYKSMFTNLVKSILAHKMVEIVPVAVNLKNIRSSKARKFARQIMRIMSNDNSYMDVSNFNDLANKLNSLNRRICKTIECTHKTEQYSLCGDNCITEYTRISFYNSNRGKMRLQNITCHPKR